MAKVVVWVEFLWRRCSNLCGKVAEFVRPRWSGVSIFCVAKVVGLVEFLWGKMVNLCGGRCSNLCAGKVVGWVEFVCGEGGQAAGG